MVRPGPKRVVASALAATAFLLAAVAYAAASRSFKGKTSQHEPISLKVSRGFIRQLDYRIVDKCPRGEKVINHDRGFSPIPISHAKFGGTFLDHAHHGKAIVTGTIKHGVLRGSLSDRTRSLTTHKICAGKAHFRLGLH